MNSANPLVHFFWNRIRSTPLGTGLLWARSWMRNVVQDLQEKKSLSRHRRDPLIRKGLEVLNQVPGGVDFRIPVKRAGAWQVELDIDHRNGSPQPVYLSWEDECEHLKNPFGGREASFLVRPGKHRYTLYLPLQQETRGRLRLTTPGTSGWDMVPAGEGLYLAGNGGVGNRTLLQNISFSIPRSKTSVLPTYLLLPITSFCNYKCVMCDHGIDNVPNKAHYPDVLADMMIEFLNGATQAYKVALTGLGESLMSPVFYRIVDSVRNPLVRFHFCSNAALLNQKRTDWILASPFSHLNVSLDAGTAATYYKIRRADWGRVVANLETFAEALARSGRTDFRLLLNMTLMKENVDEIKTFIDLAKRLGAGAYVNQLNRFGLHEQWVVENPDFVFRYADQHLYSDDLASTTKLREASEYAWNLGVPFKPEDLMRPLLYKGTNALPDEKARADEVPPISQCPYPWTGDADSTAVIAADGHVQMCCMQLPVGKITEHDTLESVWNGPTAQEVRRDMLAGKIPQPCSGANCWFVARQRAFDGQDQGKIPLPLVA